MIIRLTNKTKRSVISVDGESLDYQETRDYSISDGAWFENIGSRSELALVENIKGVIAADLVFHTILSTTTGNTITEEHIGGGSASSVTVDTTNFSKNLSSADGLLQHALETIDQMQGGGQSIYDAIVDANGNGDYTDIESAWNAGKYKLYIKAGEYTLADSLTVPYINHAYPEVQIIGDSSSSVKINISGIADGNVIKFAVGDSLSLGDVAFTNGSDTIVIPSSGVTANMVVGDCIHTGYRLGEQTIYTTSIIKTITDNGNSTHTLTFTQVFPFMSATNAAEWYKTINGFKLKGLSFYGNGKIIYNNPTVGRLVNSEFVDLSHYFVDTGQFNDDRLGMNWLIQNCFVNEIYPPPNSSVEYCSLAYIYGDCKYTRWEGNVVRNQGDVTSASPYAYLQIYSNTFLQATSANVIDFSYPPNTPGLISLNNVTNIGTIVNNSEPVFFILLSTSSYQLPKATEHKNHFYAIKNRYGNNATISSAEGNIDDSATYTLANNAALQVFSDGTQWWIV